MNSGVKTEAQKDDTVAWWHWHRHLYNWVMGFANSKHGASALFLMSFAESSFFPIPPDVLLGPLALGAPKKWLRFAFWCSAASILGGILGYGIGMFLWSAIGDWVIDHMAWAGMTAANFGTFQNWYDTHGFLIVFLCGFTPLPYKVCTISAGIAAISFPGFIVASAISRSARFFLVAGLFGWKGEAIRPFVEKYLNWLSLAFGVLLIAGFVFLKSLH